MKYSFNKIILHNFLSFGDAEIDLTDKGYCLVKGVNENTLDKATSNGAGKSTISNAICWVLTNQTISGLKSNIENINTTGGCFVKLFLSADNDEYEITRYKNHEVFKTDLKIILNGQEISGKGIRESENVLTQYLSGLTNELLRSVILLGQNLPDSFTKNTPSGRKELLEKLTHSDFMIQDVKDRIAVRLENLSSNKRLLEDELLTLTTKKTLTEQNLEQLNVKLENLTAQIDFKKVLDELEKEITSLKETISIKETHKETINKELDLQNNLLTSLKEEYTNQVKCVADVYNEKKVDLITQITDSKGKKTTIENELHKLNSIVDVCPTCGQKIPGVFKPDTTELEASLVEVNGKLFNLNTNKEELDRNYSTEINTLNQTYQDKFKPIESQIVDYQGEISNLSDIINNYQEELTGLIVKSTRIKTEQENHNSNLISTQDEIKTTTQQLEELNSQMLYNNRELESLQEHIDMINKINTVVKRDFRGYLLIDIINFIDRKSKEYSEYVFNSRDLNIVLEGNDINIYYCNKPFDNLSGGEKKKVDCIIQFAIRSLMCEYFDFKSNILFLDELFDELDLVGCEGLIDLITNTLSDIESVFIISHHESELEIPIDSELTVTKNMKGISSVN